MKNTQDSGCIVYCPKTDKFYTGYGWHEQLRNAKIYHSIIMASKVFEKYPELELEIYRVNIRVDSVEKLVPWN